MHGQQNITTSSFYFQAIKAEYAFSAMYYPAILLLYGWFGEFVITEVSK
jgi:hypothetical protein